MFLAWKEIRYEKVRYGLITCIILLISYLIFILSALAFGLANENTQVIKEWQMQTIILNENSNLNLNQSILTKQDLEKNKLTKQDASIGQVPIVVKKAKRKTVSSQLIAIKREQYIFKTMSLVAGRKFNNKHEVVVDSLFNQYGYQIGDKIKFNGKNDSYKIVGFVKNAKLNIAPLVYGDFSLWKKIRPMAPTAQATAIVSQRKLNYHHKQAKNYSTKQFVLKLPGYVAQNTTFEMMITFLFIISLITIAIFLYIVTMHKLPSYAVLRAQGVSAKMLVKATVLQSFLLSIVGSMFGLIFTLLTLKAMPITVPMYLSSWMMVSVILGMIVVGLVGSLITVRSILKVDPASAIN
ncbi:ABC transporter permease [Lactobacillus iners]|uniref:ABC transporter permease n=1 Tax=Lactobacillus iners TaxID=147802 RepID=UPI00254D6343|nr:ABC transporter permease [Lactobacillus iners]MCT7670781.1 ABC transporter permease [Lactobacillus iners]MCT7678773.1 ABC transporter permease [Lactobacillus iners]MCT7684490.1 ABC transporter permease [Lactobacillus iners]MCT7684804.1 ABC transporter permease [Lactobacillus iners]MCT7812106.1 ABC transporter permease [Lactobacillus iners]